MLYIQKRFYKNSGLWPSDTDNDNEENSSSDTDDNEKQVET